MNQSKSAYQGWIRSSEVKQTAEKHEQAYLNELLELQRKRKEFVNFKDYSPEQHKAKNKASSEAKKINGLALAFLICLFRQAGLRNKQVAQLFHLTESQCTRRWKTYSPFLCNQRGEVYPHGDFSLEQLKLAFSRSKDFIPVGVLSAMKEVELEKIALSVYKSSIFTNCNFSEKSIFNILLQLELIECRPNHSRRKIHTDTENLINEGRVRIKGIAFFYERDQTMKDIEFNTERFEDYLLAVWNKIEEDSEQPGLPEMSLSEFWDQVSPDMRRMLPVNKYIEMRDEVDAILLSGNPTSRMFHEVLKAYEEVKELRSTDVYVVGINLVRSVLQKLS